MQIVRNLAAAVVLGLALSAAVWAVLSLAPSGPGAERTDARAADRDEPAAAATEAECRQDRRPRLSRDACTALIDAGEYAGKPLASIHFNRANAHRRLGDLAAAVADYDAAIRLVPTSWAYFMNRAMTKKMMGQTRAALADIRHALKLDPGNPRLHFNFGTMLASMGKNEQALVELNAALDGRPGYPLAHVLRGVVHQRLGRGEAARRDWRDAFEQGGQRFAVRVQRLLERHGHYRPVAGIYESKLTPEIEKALMACAADVGCL